ncbi:hypothetical protein INT45_011024 [Circinella minor]|uniref:Dolichyl-phosphate-mannose--protein mannosyltransferase n=1 Tax=Circinella minor TaxID=1195481 RepID=A0A8H7VR25_9FUNG|nr:hypothetical protein INT45_011024 [Circinella minor]
MPALYYAVLLFGSMFDLSTSCLTSRKRTILVTIAIVCVIYTYRSFIPITYGEPWSQTSCENAKWTNSWDFNCVRFNNNSEKVYQEKASGAIRNFGIEKLYSFVKDYLGIGGRAQHLLEDSVFEGTGDERAME